jgi:hypothetical protein
LAVSVSSWIVAARLALAAPGTPAASPLPALPEEPPPPVFASPPPADAVPADMGAARIVDDPDCAAQIAALAKRARAGAAAYHGFARELRTIALENPGPKHRRVARRALVKLLLLRAELVTAGEKPACDAATGPLTAADLTGLENVYGLAEGGAPAAKALADVLRKNADDAGAEALRIVAANSLASTGAVPPADAAVELDRWIDAAAKRSGPAAAVARLELALALAAHAQRAKEAYAILQARLLRDDCAFAATLAYELPSEDLRYSLFRKLRDDKRARAQAIRQWVRAPKLPVCSG